MKEIKTRVFLQDVSVGALEEYLGFSSPSISGEIAEKLCETVFIPQLWRKYWFQLFTPPSNLLFRRNKENDRYSML